MCGGHNSAITCSSKLITIQKFSWTKYRGGVVHLKRASQQTFHYAERFPRPRLNKHLENKHRNRHFRWCISHAEHKLTNFYNKLPDWSCLERGQFQYYTPTVSDSFVSERYPPSQVTKLCPCLYSRFMCFFRELFEYSRSALCWLSEKLDEFWRSKLYKLRTQVFPTTPPARLIEERSINFNFIRPVESQTGTGYVKRTENLNKLNPRQNPSL